VRKCAVREEETKRRKGEERKKRKRKKRKFRKFSNLKFFGIKIKDNLWDWSKIYFL
jgi:hypothetical protein